MTVQKEKIQNSSEGVQGSEGSVDTSQTDIYSQFRPLIKLYGESYDPLKKAVFYSLIGSVICSNKIVCSDINEDTRINLFVPLKSGHGKREVKEVIKQSIQNVGLSYCEPTSLHSEQLIGKTISNKKDESIINKGHLSEDYLIFEESSELFTDKTYQETRDYIKIALDPIGYNEVYKKSVDTFKKNAVKYCPRCTIVFFFQPLPIDDKVVTRGLLRRGIILSIDPLQGERYDALDQSLLDNDVSDDWNHWIEFLQMLKAKEFNWEFDDGVKASIVTLSKELIKQGYQKGNKASAYTEIMFFSLRNLLVKMSCIQAAINRREMIIESDVDKAYADLSAFWDIQLEFVIQKVKGEIDYMDMTKEEKSCLLILQSSKCDSEDNNHLMIKEYVELISSELQCTGDRARHLYYGLKESGYLNSKQVGQYDSKVWLTDMGKKKVEPYATLASLTTLNKKPSILQRFRRKSKVSQ
ncbi:hypothetical protein MBGDF03_00125 [Thermoplasmatales archaeon SCGC AB-540-F20]|nr:hypothetical protein MBGDF03_00125 [Thermoplasmatales archaeon SCGC AB-540-F20]